MLKEKKKSGRYSYFNLINAHLFRYDTFKYQDNQMINNSLELNQPKNPSIRIVQSTFYISD